MGGFSPHTLIKALFGTEDSQLVRYREMRSNTATQDLDTRVKKARLRVQTHKSLSKRPLNFVDGSTKEYFPCNGEVREAAVECCGESTAFPKGKKIRVTLPAEVNCGGCDTTYVMEQHNSAKGVIYSR